MFQLLANYCIMWELIGYNAVKMTYQNAQYHLGNGLIDYTEPIDESLAGRFPQSSFSPLFG